MCLGEILRVKAPKSELVSRAGVHYAGYVFSTEGIIFRETSSSDVGIDGQLELVSDDGTATGMLLGVQVKSGDSFVDNISGKNILNIGNNYVYLLSGLFTHQHLKKRLGLILRNMPI